MSVRNGLRDVCVVLARSTAMTFDAGLWVLIVLLMFWRVGSQSSGAEFLIIAQNDTTRKAVTPDGRIVMLNVYEGEVDRNTNTLAAIWTREKGLVKLGTLPGDDGSVARGISADGTVVGYSYSANSDKQKVFIWNERDGMSELPLPLDGRVYPIPHISADGSTVAGFIDFFGGEQSSLVATFRWTKGDDAVSLINPPFYVFGLSADGSTIVGGTTGNALSDQSIAVAWTATGGTRDLGSFGGLGSTATDVSADGSVIVGLATINWPPRPRQCDYQMFRWTEKDGMVGLGCLPGENDSSAWDVTADGKVVVGNHGRTNFVDRSFYPAVWDEGHGMRDLETVLRDEHGLTDFHYAGGEWGYGRAISDDKKTIAGNIFRERSPFVEESKAWVVYLDRPIDSWSPDAGDFNGDGLRNTVDINSLSEQVRSGGTDLKFELYNDGQINERDRVSWVKHVKETWFGDANLDGQFNSADVVQVFQSALFETGRPALWEHGDWNGDGQFGTSDLVTAFQDGGYDRGPRAVAVPEPSGWLPIISCILTACTGLGRKQMPPA